ncbi:30S ribosomal protein S4e [Natrialba aegyptia]|uniref:Small ribosomal subunit protein eS4 n=1 Tax=Natrialba aegyptia DSM 13077 TaxID=1227491 RepID=M0AX59_9EURY|nr:30S ribosomal protein S4e [Natrialba aegyptia]ELZ03291.1 30S ribosomal protein S4e [Natrialba aegyptia DSM 13077]
MTKHQKRLSVPKSWPVERKTEVFTVKADAGPHGEEGVPLVVLLRDVLGYVDSAKEARYALSEDSIIVNGEPINDEQRPIGIFDILAFPGRGEFYRVFPDEGGRLALTEIDEESADSRLGKIDGKQQVPGGDTQLTLHDGTTVLVDDEFSAKDSVVVDNEDKSIVAHFPYEEGALVTAIRGNHGGKIGEVESIDVTPGSGSNTVTVSTDDGAFETVEEYVVVIDENFTGEDSDAESEERQAASDGGDDE